MRGKKKSSPSFRGKAEARQTPRGNGVTFIWSPEQEELTTISYYHVYHIKPVNMNSIVAMEFARAETTKSTSKSSCVSGLAGLNPVSGREGGAKSARVFSTAISHRSPGILATDDPAGWTTSKDNDLG
ncbi:hypothetical protein ALC60_04714 [Trachymyrmex zeteki]|uniref:Uncharacterized protein n=1 Tax=Mycetomoellerius zeteki TaxID=64791 RepID=A0A151X7F9_9HYME|nr:hypothetical protein ALC60_04714 [Trachymyrmex zeteki]